MLFLAIAFLGAIVLGILFLIPSFTFPIKYKQEQIQVSSSSLLPNKKHESNNSSFFHLRKHLRMQGRTKTGINTDEV